MNIVAFEVKKNIKSILIWSGITTGVLFLFMCMFPSMKSNDMMDIVNAKMDAFPPVVLEMFNLSEMPNFSNILDYFAYSFQFILMVVGIYGAIIGSGLLSKEEDEGTIEFLYSKPVTRGEIVVKKLIAGTLSFSIFLILVGIGSMISILVFGGEIDMKILMSVKEILVGAFIVGIVFMIVGCLISVLIKNNRSSVQVGLGIFFGTYMIGILSKLSENVEWIKIFSPYDKFIPADIVKNNLDLGYIGIVTGVIICSILMILYKYKRRDFHI